MFVRLFIIHGGNSKSASQQRDSKVVIATHQSIEPLQHPPGATASLKGTVWAKAGHDTLL